MHCSLLLFATILGAASGIPINYGDWPLVEQLPPNRNWPPAGKLPPSWPPTGSWPPSGLPKPLPPAGNKPLPPSELRQILEDILNLLPPGVWPPSNPWKPWPPVGGNLRPGSNDIYLPANPIPATKPAWPQSYLPAGGSNKPAWPQGEVFYSDLWKQ